MITTHDETNTRAKTPILDHHVSGTPPEITLRLPIGCPGDTGGASAGGVAASGVTPQCWAKLVLMISRIARVGGRRGAAGCMAGVCWVGAVAREGFGGLGRLGMGPIYPGWMSLFAGCAFGGLV